jgi:hypothetical protein
LPLPLRLAHLQRHHRKQRHPLTPIAS